jgi:pyruvate/2-oxoglutarate dehydrogenase complex dihydrolipoamide acyltransferase (E2) component
VSQNCPIKQGNLERAMEKRTFDLKTPDLGDSDKIELVKWYLKLGDLVSEGQEILELVTDKASFPVESPVEGSLDEIYFPEGSQVKKGDILGRLATKTS